MPTAECQNSAVEGKILGLHSTVFSKSYSENKRLNLTIQSKNTKQRQQLRRLGWEPGSSYQKGVQLAKKPRQFHPAFTSKPTILSKKKKYYKILLKSGQTLRVDFRTPDAGGSGWVTTYNSDCGREEARLASGSSQLVTVQSTATVNGLAYWSVEGYVSVYQSPTVPANSAYRVSIH
jgi:hypothetical protein